MMSDDSSSFDGSYWTILDREMIVFRVFNSCFNIDCFMGVLNTYVGCNWTNWNSGVWNIGLTAENWFSIWLFWGLQLFLGVD